MRGWATTVVAKTSLARSFRYSYSVLLCVEKILVAQTAGTEPFRESWATRPPERLNGQHSEPTSRGPLYRTFGHFCTRAGISRYVYNCCCFRGLVKVSPTRLIDFKAPTSEA